MFTCRQLTIWLLTIFFASSAVSQTETEQFTRSLPTRILCMQTEFNPTANTRGRWYILHMQQTATTNSPDGSGKHMVRYFPAGHIQPRSNGCWLEIKKGEGGPLVKNVRPGKNSSCAKICPEINVGDWFSFDELDANNQTVYEFK